MFSDKKFDHQGHISKIPSKKTENIGHSKNQLGSIVEEARPSQTKDVKLVVEAPFSNSQHIKGS